jgi:hypothetical protein
VVYEPLGSETLPDPRLFKEVRDAVLDDARAESLLNVLPTSPFEDDGVDTGLVEQMP